MAQKLALPINKCNITVMFKEDSPGYAHDWYPPCHFGMDMTGTVNPFYASGVGKVVGVGGAATVGVGFWAAIQYDNVYKWSMSSSSLTTLSSVIVRYFHLAAKPALTVGQSVSLATKIGTYSNTGSAKMNAHLHVEVDTDVNYPLYTPTLEGAAGGLYAGTRGTGDTTIDPSSVFFIKTSADEYQALSYSQSYCNTHGTAEPYINTAKITKWKQQTFA